MKLTSENVHEVFMNCLFDDNEDKNNYVVGEGVMKSAGFHPERLSESKDAIISMLNDLPDNFQKEKGGGWSFLNACETKDGYQWTDLHTIIDELIILGSAIGCVDFCAPREMWKIFPGGMPYFSITNNPHPAG